MSGTQGRIVYIALGSNLGDREATLRGALSALNQPPNLSVVAVSSLYETEPVGGPEQSAYLNAAAAIITAFEPLALLDALQAIEKTFHRTREVRWGARTLDLDVLLDGDLVLHHARLQIPHARLSERRFVLEPLAEIAAAAIDPVSGRSIGDVLETLPPARPSEITVYKTNWAVGNQERRC